MQFVIKRHIIKIFKLCTRGREKNILILNILIELKNKKLSIIATDLDIIFKDEIDEVKSITEVAQQPQQLYYLIFKKMPLTLE